MVRNRKNRKHDPRDVTTLVIREINRYVEVHPELKAYYTEFKDFVFSRMDSIAMNIFTARDNRGIDSMDDPQYKIIEEIIESAYPTWNTIRDLLLAGKPVKFPTIPKYVMDGKVPLGQY